MAWSGRAANGAPHTDLCFEVRWLALPVVPNLQSLRGFPAGAPASLLIRKL